MQRWSARYSVLIGLYIFLFKGKTLVFAYAVSGCIGLSLLVAMLVSSAVGTCIPLFFKKVGVDPAVASGPLITTMNDLVAVITYYKNRQISEICRITEKLPIQKNSGSKDSGFFFTYKQKAIIMKDTLCPFKTLQK